MENIENDKKINKLLNEFIKKNENNILTKKIIKNTINYYLCINEYFFNKDYENIYKKIENENYNFTKKEIKIIKLEIKYLIIDHLYNKLYDHKLNILSENDLNNLISNLLFNEIDNL